MRGWAPSTGALAPQTLSLRVISPGVSLIWSRRHCAPRAAFTAPATVTIAEEFRGRGAATLGTLAVNDTTVAMAAAPSLSLWASGAARSLPASFDPAAAQLRAELGVFDRLLDALAFSRGRFAIGVPGAAPLIVPNWPEATRAIEDCRN